MLARQQQVPLLPREAKDLDIQSAHPCGELHLLSVIDGKVDSKDPVRTSRTDALLISSTACIANDSEYATYEESD